MHNMKQLFVWHGNNIIIIIIHSFIHPSIHSFVACCAAALLTIVQFDCLRCATCVKCQRNCGQREALVLAVRAVIRNYEPIETLQTKTVSAEKKVVRFLCVLTKSAQ